MLSCRQFKDFTETLYQPTSLHGFYSILHESIDTFVPHNSLTPNIISPGKKLLGINTVGGNVPQGELDTFIPHIDRHLVAESPHGPDILNDIWALRFKGFRSYPEEARKRYLRKGNLHDIYRQIETRDIALATIDHDPVMGWIVLSIDRPDKDFTLRELDLLQSLYPVIRGQFKFHLMNFLHADGSIPEGVSREELAPVWFDEHGNTLAFPQGTRNVLELVFDGHDHLIKRFEENLSREVTRLKCSHEIGGPYRPIPSINHESQLHCRIQPCTDRKSFRVAYLWLRDNCDPHHRFHIRDFVFHSRPSIKQHLSRAMTQRVLFDWAQGLSPAEIQQKQGLDEKTVKTSMRRIERALESSGAKRYADLPLSMDTVF